MIAEFGAANLTLGGLLAVILLLLLRAFVAGTLVPSSTVTQVREDSNARVATADARATEWRDVAMGQQVTIRTLAQQLDAMVALGRTSAHVLQSLPRPAGEQATIDAADAAATSALLDTQGPT